MIPTDEKITRRLAEMRGWTLRPERPTQVSEHPYTEIRHSGEIVRWAYWGAHGQAFSPLTDRNTAHECMLAMPEAKRGMVCFELLMVVCPNGPDGMNVYDINWLMIAATPRQLCMAMYAALGEK